MRKSDSDSRSFPVVTLKKRLLVNDPFHRKFCWDLLIYDSDGNRTLEDVATERKYAERLLASFAENKSVRFKPRMCWKTFLRIRSIWNRNRRCKKARSEVFTPPFTDPFNTPGAPPKSAIGRKPSGFFCSSPGFTCSHSFVPPVATGIFYFSVAFSVPLSFLPLRYAQRPCCPSV